MSESRKLYTGEESAGRGLLVLRLASAVALLLTLLFILLLDRAKHDLGLVRVNPFAEDPYDAVGSFGVQIGLACAALSALRAFRTDLKTESLCNRYTYTLRAIAASQLTIIVTMLADLVAIVRYSSLWDGTSAGNLLVTFTVGLLVLVSGFCMYLMRLAKRRDVCSKNPLLQPQIVPFLILLGLVGIYPGGWRDGIVGAVLTALAGMMYLFFSVALLSKAMFPCPDVPEKDLIDDLVGIYQIVKPRSGRLARLIASIEHRVRSTCIRTFIDRINPRKHEWNLLASISILVGFLLALGEIFSEGPSPGLGRILLVSIVFIVLESAGVVFGYALLRRFLGLVRAA